MGALSGALPTGAIPLRLATMATPASGARDHTLIAVLGLPPIPAGTSAEEYDLTVAVFDGEGRRELQRQQHVVSLTAGDTTTRGVVDIPLRLSLRPGRYNVRSAVVRRRTGTAGSVYATVVMPDFARESLTLSGAALGDPRAPLRATDPLAKFLPFAPTVRRTFTTVDQVTAYVAVHQPTGKTAASVELVSEILSEDGATVRRAARTIPAAAFAGVPGVAHTYDLPVATLPPGAYLARFTARSPTGSAERTVSFLVR